MPQTGLQRLVPDAPQALCDILDGRRGAMQPPIRSEIFGSQRFAQHGRSLGETHRAERPGWRSPSFFPRLRNNIRVLREAHRYIGEQASTGYDISPAAEWLLDNFHLIEAQLKEIHDGLPRSYFRSLPLLLDPPLAGLPRVYGIAWAFVAHTDGAFDEDLLVQFLNAYQETRELNLSEMWALPTTLRVVLVESLRRLAERVATNKAARAVANLCCDRIESYTPKALDELLALLNQRGVGQVFLVQMAQRLQDLGSANDASRQVHKQWLQKDLPDLAAVQKQQPSDQAADNLSVSNAVRSLRAIGDANWADIVERSNTLMQLMLTQPTFESEHSDTRDQTLHGIELLARRCARSELSVAHALLALMRAAEPGNRATAVSSYWLRGAGRPQLARTLGLRAGAALGWRAAARRVALPTYLGTLLIGTTGLVAWMLVHQQAALGDAVAAPGWWWLAAVLMAFPASEAVVAVINRLISESARPRHLPRLALADGIPRAHRVMVVIPGMLTSATSARDLLHRLLLHYLANPEHEAQFALLTDWADADSENLAADQELLDSAVAQLQALNTRYPRGPADQASGPRFILLHRLRTFSATEQRWIGWERKRGKLEQLLAALAQGQHGSFLDLGEVSRMATSTLYVVTLDSDTQLPPGRLRDLVGVAAHPHNQPCLDSTGRRVVGGYGILQPRIVTPLPAHKDFTLYHWLFAGQCGTDPYSAATSEIYQDVFGEGTFTGKGLLNVQAVHAVLAGRLPEGRVLSHDLLEGSLARCAAVTDITVIEDAPFHADVAASRLHRWIRGDWQLLPFLMEPARYPFKTINRWKMFDNLRRSLVAPMSLALLVLALGGAVLSPLAALALVLAALSAGPLMGAVAGFAPSRDDIAKRHFYSQAGTDLLRAVLGGLWLLTQLLAQALLAGDALLRALYRMLVSHRLLLQWTTAETAQAKASTRLGPLVRSHWREPLAALLLIAGLLLAGTATPALALALCLLWATGALWVWCVSRKRPTREDAALSARDQAYLRDIARDTWKYFERCVTAADNHLPPDNLQITPQDMLAHRTSPTNIGLYLLSVACAGRFGWISTSELLARLEATLDTLDTLQRHQGHFLNWYDTQTLAPLLPMYVSTVDSGNLCGHLLALAQACLELAALEADGLAAGDGGPVAAPGTSSTRLNALAQRCDRLAWEADFCFLYHRKRHLLHIGYRVAEHHLDASFYDLLASESRLTSLLAIAKGDVPVRHWASLGRPFYAVGATAGLRSWSGSMFEYLMPTLVLDEPDGSVLREACAAALEEQIAFARTQAVPWGISESAYAGSDHTLAYQYAPQGVPRLALRRTPPQELVIAPYATALAAQIAPHRAISNLTALEALSARGELGFIEALDFTRARQSGDEAFTPVSTFMAHHQGMSIVALANVLLDGVAQRWGMANAHIQAVSSLLHERAPREVSVLHAPPTGPLPQALLRRAPGLLRNLVPGSGAVEPTHVLSNGRYSVTLRPNGAGWSRWGQTGITRYRDDALRDACGSFFYLRSLGRSPALGQTGSGMLPGALVSITQHPAPDSSARYQSTYHADRVCFDAVWADVQAYTTVWVSPEDDIEFRKIELRNLSDQPLEIELVSSFEVTLADPRADDAHPAFSNLFVRAQWLAEHQALVFERRPRLATEAGMQAAHFLTDIVAQVTQVGVQTDRQRWLGRNRSASHPLASFDPVPNLPDLPAGTATPDPAENGSGENTLTTGLDPVACFSVRLRIDPHSRANLTFATAAGENGATLRAVMDKYRQPGNVRRSSLMSATLTGIRLRTLGLGAENFAALQTLATALVMNLTRAQEQPAPTQRLTAAVCDRRLLWRFGISGERPIILVSASATQGLGLLRSLVQGLNLWSWGGLACDLVVLNSEATSYLMEVQREITAMRERYLAESTTSPSPASNSLLVLRTDDISSDELSTLQTLARVQFNADGRPLTHHVQEWGEAHQAALAQRQGRAMSPMPVVSVLNLPVTVSAGQFATPSGDFRFDVNASMRPLRPWINVLANPDFGCHISDGGGGYTWAQNSRLNQLTPWSNDPIADPPSEWFLLQDRKTLEVWSMTPGAWGDGGITYHLSHGQGSSTFQHRRGDVEVNASWCVDPHSAVKQVRLRIVNQGSKAQYLRAIGIAEWMLGASRADRSTVLTGISRTRVGTQQLTALLATQQERAAGFGNGTAFLAVAGLAEDTPDWTCDRRECLDASGRPVVPDHFGQRCGGGLDPCAALSVKVRLAAGETAERVFLLGYAASPDAAHQLIAEVAAVPAANRLELARRSWDVLLEATSVKTPDPLFDAMVNRWLLYQTVSCRLWAKAGFYQAGGATGFRDQLQDAMALAWAAPDLLRQQIVLCASRQFPEGDVQHWWHAPGGAGVRTHFSDDLLWLPYATLHYLRATGDTTLLDHRVPFLNGAAIPEGAEDAYYTPTVSDDSASVFEHGALAIDHSLRVGVHGLPLMGSGDWNDGMNRVGIEGRGESVWLGWFLCALVAEFAPLARSRGDTLRAQTWEDAATGWRAALNGPAWDGQWFRRAFFDDGQALGSHTNPEARIDLIAQAWSALSGAAQPALQRMALNAMEEHLVDAQAGLIRLLHPPLDHAIPSAGYIQAYPPGVRENGGQYSHAGVWALMAQAQAQTQAPLQGAAGASAALAAGAPDAADTPYRYFTYLSPAHRARHATHGALYGIEPYVVAGDVYSQPPYVGRGGWSWYTGAAAWLHRAAIESIFGLRQGAQELFFNPCLPTHWTQAELTLRRDGRTMRFILLRASAEAAVVATSQWQARLLLRNTALQWRDLPAQSCFVIPLA